MEPKAQDRAKYALGVLFVHGIGSPRYADTLLSCGEPFIETLSKWAEGVREPRWRPLPQAAVLRQPSRSEDDPAWSSVDFVDGQGDPIQSWLLAESWWSAAFVPPTYGRLARWTSEIAPWAVAFWARRQVDSAMMSMTIGVVRDYQRRNHRWKRLGRPIVFVLSWWRIIKLLLRLLMFLFALLLIPLLIATVILLLLVGLLPVPQLRSFIRNVQGRLTNSIGDSFVLLSSPMQAAAIMTKVEQGLRWIEERAKRVVVIAHSQGAAIAHQVIRALPDEGRPRLFVSVGSGLKQLTEIRAVQRSGRRWYPLVPSVGLLLLGWAMRTIYRIVVAAPGVETTAPQLALWAYLAVLVMVFAQIAFRGGHSVGVLIFQLFVAALTPLLAFAPEERGQGWIAFAGLVLLLYGIGLLGPRGTSQSELMLPGGIRWLDYFSTHDPVPNGALLEDLRDGYSIESFEVHNRASVISDHVIYWANPEGFVLPAALAATQTAHLPDVSEDDDDTARILVGHYRRRWRVRWLIWLRGIILATFTGMALGGWNGRLLDVGSAAWGRFRSLYDMLPLVSAENLQAHLKVGAQRWAGLAALALATWLVYAIFLALWKGWDHHDRSIFFARRGFPMFSGPTAAFVAALVVATIVAGVLVNVWTDGISTRATIAVYIGVSLVVVGTTAGKWGDWSRSGPPQQVLRIRTDHLTEQLDAVAMLAEQRERTRANLTGVMVALGRLILDPARAVVVYLSRPERLEGTASLFSQEGASLVGCLTDIASRKKLLGYPRINERVAAMEELARQIEVDEEE